MFRSQREVWSYLNGHPVLFRLKVCRQNSNLSSETAKTYEFLSYRGYPPNRLSRHGRDVQDTLGVLVPSALVSCITTLNIGNTNCDFVKKQCFKDIVAIKSFLNSYLTLPNYDSLNFRCRLALLRVSLRRAPRTGCTSPSWPGSGSSRGTGTPRNTAGIRCIQDPQEKDQSYTTYYQIGFKSILRPESDQGIPIQGSLSGQIVVLGWPKHNRQKVEQPQSNSTQLSYPTRWTTLYIRKFRSGDATGDRAGADVRGRAGSAPPLPLLDRPVLPLPHPAGTRATGITQRKRCLNQC